MTMRYVDLVPAGGVLVINKVTQEGDSILPEKTDKVVTMFSQ
jgi:hypothetical protein